MRLKEIRKEKKISQLKLAMALNTNQNTISRYETGEREPGINELIKIADYFGVSVDRVLNPQPEDAHKPVQPQMSAKELEAWKTIQDTASRVLGTTQNEESPTPEGVELSDGQKAAMDIVMQMSDDQLRRFIKMAEIMLEEPSGKSPCSDFSRSWPGSAAVP